MNSLLGELGHEVSFKLLEMSCANSGVLSFDEQSSVSRPLVLLCTLSQRPCRLRVLDILSFIIRKPVSVLGVPTACWLIRTSLQRISSEMFG